MRSRKRGLWPRRRLASTSGNLVQPPAACNFWAGAAGLGGYPGEAAGASDVVAQGGRTFPPRRMELLRRRERIVLSSRAPQPFLRAVRCSCRNVVHVRFGWPYFGVRGRCQDTHEFGRDSEFSGLCNAGVIMLLLLEANARLLLLFSPTACRRGSSTAGG
jgi:hypothetical protein